TVGFQFRNDHISNVALNHTRQRQLVNQVSQDDVNIAVLSTYFENETPVADMVRTIVGLRGDWYRFHDEDQLTPADSGDESAAIFSPKAGVILGPWSSTELFVNWGLGFHSNDARGVTTTIDPATPLVRSNGSEVGARSWLTEQWQATLTGWYLELDSE